MLIMRVSATTSASKLAGAVAGQLRSEGTVIVQAVGPNAVNQAIKAIALARGFMAPSGMDLTVVPQFAAPDDEVTEGKEPLQSAMRLIVRTVPDTSANG